MENIKDFLRRGNNGLYLLASVGILAGLIIFLVQSGKTQENNPLQASSTPVENAAPFDVVYLSVSPGKETGDIWKVPASGGQGVPLTSTGGAVQDYAVSQDGQFLAYIAANEQGGADLWTIYRDSTKAVRLVACGIEQCSSPAWSMDGKRIAYSRSIGQGSSTTQAGASRVWLVDVADGQVTPLYQDPAVLGTTPVWSPDGSRIAIFDGNSRSIRVFDLKTNQDVLIHTSLGEVGCWSPDGSKMLYGDIQTAAIPEVVIYLADLTTGQPVLVLGKSGQSIDYSTPDWSPDGAWIVFGAGDAKGAGGKQLSVARPDGTDMTAVTTDLAYTNVNYHWDASSQALVFQRYKLGQTFIGPEIVIWQMSEKEVKVIAENGILPQWLP